MRKMRLLHQNLTKLELRETGIRETVSQFEKLGVTTAGRTAFRMPSLNRVLDSPFVNGGVYVEPRKCGHRLLALRGQFARRS